MKMDFGKTKSLINFEDVSISDKIPYLYFTDVKHTRNSMQTVPLIKRLRLQRMLTDCIDVFLCTWKKSILIFAILKFW